MDLHNASSSRLELNITENIEKPVVEVLWGVVLQVYRLFSNSTFCPASPVIPIYPSPDTDEKLSVTAEDPIFYSVL